MVLIPSANDYVSQFKSDSQCFQDRMHSCTFIMYKLSVAQIAFPASNLEEALTLELLNPSFGTIVRHVILIVLVTHEADEFAITFRFGGIVFITVCGSESHHLASSSFEKIIQLAGSIAVILQRVDL